MDELKLLIEMVANLPQMAIWVLVAFWAYKVVVIGSIYGVIRLAIVKLHDWLTTPRFRRHYCVQLCVNTRQAGAICMA